MEPRKPKKSARRLNNVIPFRLDAAFFFERGVHHLDRHNLPSALKYFGKAVEYEPENAVNHCNLAGVLSEMGQYEESNKVLEHVLKEIDEHMYECYFYMANNWANLGDYDLAEEYSAKYLDLDPNGEFAEDTEEMLDILVQEFGGGEVLKQRENIREQEEADEDLARKLLEQGRFIEATRHLEKTISEQPGATAPRNNLSLAFYYLGQLDRAIEIAEDVLVRDPANVHACCNLAVYYQHLGYKEPLANILSALRKVYPMQYEQAYKLATTMGILGEHETAYRLFRQISKWSDRKDPILMHCVAAAACNLGKYKYALRVWEDIRESDPESEVAPYYLMHVENAIATHQKPATISYQYHIPFHEQFQKMKEQLEQGRLDNWQHDPLIRSSLFWALRHGDLETKMQVIQTFSLIADPDVEEALREFIRTRDEMDQLKRLALYVLRHMGAVGPFEAFLDNKKVLIQIESDEQYGILDVKTKWKQVVELAETHLDRYGKEAVDLAYQLWTSYLQQQFQNPPRITKEAVWAASLDYVVSHLLGYPVTQAEVAKIYRTSASTVSKISRALFASYKKK